MSDRRETTAKREQALRLRDTNPDLSQTDIANSLGVNKGTVSRWFAEADDPRVLPDADGNPVEMRDADGDVTTDGLAALALNKARDYLSLSPFAMEAKEAAASAKQLGQLWAILKGKATLRERDRDEEEPSSSEIEELVQKILGGEPSK